MREYYGLTVVIECACLSFNVVDCEFVAILGRGWRMERTAPPYIRAELSLVTSSGVQWCFCRVSRQFGTSE